MAETSIPSATSRLHLQTKLPDMAENWVKQGQQRKRTLSCPALDKQKGDRFPDPLSVYIEGLARQNLNLAATP
jgi:hypothetical protein